MQLAIKLLFKFPPHQRLLLHYLVLKWMKKRQ